MFLSLPKSQFVGVKDGYILVKTYLELTPAIRNDPNTDTPQLAQLTRV